jgi:hypothetical protein
MPLAWIHKLSREDAEKLAMGLGAPVRKGLKNKWKALETYLPPQSADKSEVAMHTVGVSDTRFTAAMCMITLVILSLS